MRCFETESQLVELLDGKLDQARELAMHAHLETCAECRRRAEVWGHLMPVMRRLAPPAPAPLRARRMELEIERLLAKPPVRPVRPARPVALATAVVLAAAAVLLVIWPRGRVGRSPLAVEVVAVAGEARAGGALLRAGQRFDAKGDVLVAEGSAVSLSLSDARLELGGATQLALGGDVGHVALGLDRGTLKANVTHRAAGATFIVSTPEGRVEVRGTRFVVHAAAGRSAVSVEDGRVAVFTRAGAERSVGVGERIELDQAGFVATPAPPQTDEAARPPAVAPGPPCEGVRPSCEATARQARASMREGQVTRALRLIDGGMAAAAGDCAGPSGSSCRDELRYLRAEALRQDGRLEAAVQAYRALDHHGAPAAMRQNAFYAAAQLERRLGRLGAARTDFERALTAAPGGALHEESLLGAMDAAAADGDARAAASFAERYLAESPQGRGAAHARAVIAKASGGRPASP